MNKYSIEIIRADNLVSLKNQLECFCNSSEVNNVISVSHAAIVTKYERTFYSAIVTYEARQHNG